jgi:hypothetical protein
LKKKTRGRYLRKSRVVSEEAEEEIKGARENEI